MLEICKGGTRPISMCVKKTQNYYFSSTAALEAKMDQTFDRPVCLIFDAS